MKIFDFAKNILFPEYEKQTNIESDASLLFSMALCIIEKSHKRLSLYEGLHGNILKGTKRLQQSQLCVDRNEACNHLFDLIACDSHISANLRVYYNNDDDIWFPGFLSIQVGGTLLVPFFVENPNVDFNCISERLARDKVRLTLNPNSHNEMWANNLENRQIFRLSREFGFESGGKDYFLWVPENTASIL